MGFKKMLTKMMNTKDTKLKVGDKTVGGRATGLSAYFIGIKGHQQVVQESADDATQAVNGGLLRQGA